MERTNEDSQAPPLHTVRPLFRRHFNRIFAILYSLTVLSLLYHHIQVAVNSDSIFTPLLLFTADSILAFIWLTSQAFRMNPVVREEFPENLPHIIARKDYPSIDIFICTADPYKEPPIVALNTALSVMAYDYPPEKLSVYVSDDGGSELTLFAFMEGAKFAKIWIHFCKENNIVDRNPEAYLNAAKFIDPEIKRLYENMKVKLESIMQIGKVSDGYILEEDDRRIMRQFAIDGFCKQNHPTVIQVLLNSNKDKDVGGGPMPSVIYVAREKRESVYHNFKAGALNVLLRVSACMTNAPIILTLDCDMFSSDPITIQRMLCYLDIRTLPRVRPHCGYVQFPQRYHGINKGDIYSGEVKMPFRINPNGFDGLKGPNHVGTGCFFRRRIFFGGPTSYIEPENPMLNPNRVVDKLIDDPIVLQSTRLMANSEYERDTHWGSKIGIFYGSLVEDYYTGFRLKCEGWQSVYCDPRRPAFLGDAPISLNDALGQIKRWCIGLLEVGFSKFSPLTFGVKSMGFLMGLGYAHYAFWPLRAIPVVIYGFFPPLALLRRNPIFPKIEDSWLWICVYLFLFLGAYAQDCFEFISKEGTFERWWSSQRIWLIQGLSSHLFGLIEFVTKCLGIATFGFNITSKISSHEQRERYDRGVFDFGVASPMFVPPVAAAIVNLVAFVWGFVLFMIGENSGCEFFLQIAVIGFVVVNSVPVYEAMAFREDDGRIPIQTTVNALIFVGVLYGFACLIF